MQTDIDKAIIALTAYAVEHQGKSDTLNLALSILQGIYAGKLVALEAANAKITDLTTQLDVANATIATLQLPETTPPIVADPATSAALPS